ncbi:MAG: hypothetical protein V1662_05675 [Candidatus Omnitrophota bacterium]
MYNLKIIPSACENLNRLAPLEFEEAKKKILGLKNNPRPSEAEALTEDGGYRIKSGEICITYRINKDEIIIYF